MAPPNFHVYDDIESLRSCDGYSFQCAVSETDPFVMSCSGSLICQFCSFSKPVLNVKPSDTTMNHKSSSGEVHPLIFSPCPVHIIASKLYEQDTTRNTRYFAEVIGAHNHVQPILMTGEEICQAKAVVTPHGDTLKQILNSRLFDINPKMTNIDYVKSLSKKSGLKNTMCPELALDFSSGWIAQIQLNS